MSDLVSGNADIGQPNATDALGPFGLTVRCRWSRLVVIVALTELWIRKLGFESLLRS